MDTDMQGLKEETALAFQYYRELLSIIDNQHISVIPNLPDSPEKDRAVILLENLHSYIENLEKHFQKSNLEEIPVMEFGTSHAKFLSHELIPNDNLIKVALFDSFNSTWGNQQPLLRRLKYLFFEPKEVGEGSSQYVGALNHLLEFWLGTLSEYEKEEYVEFIETCKELREMIKGSWFEPDAWNKRQAKLRPILLPTGSTDRLRDHVRIRIVEIYRSFIFGQFMACVALCRTLLEFVLTQKAGELGISLSNENGWDKSLSQLVQDLTQHPVLAEHAEAIREHGNRVIHPKKRSIVAVPRVLEEEALECIAHIVKVVELCYGE